MKFADFTENAAQLTEMYADVAITLQRQKAAPQQVKDADGNWPTTECEDCGLDIEPARLEMGRIRCIACQTLLEKKEGLYAKRQF